MVKNVHVMLLTFERNVYIFLSKVNNSNRILPKDSRFSNCKGVYMHLKQNATEGHLIIIQIRISLRKKKGLKI